VGLGFSGHQVVGVLVGAGSVWPTVGYLYFGVAWFGCRFNRAI
jgi:hypothetical protein